MGNQGLKITDFPFGRMKCALKMDGDDGCTGECTYHHVTIHLKVVKMVSFRSISPQ